MMFKGEFRAAIKGGRKTQTRRIKPPRYKAGSVQPVMHDYKNKASLWIKIEGIRRQRLLDITIEEIFREGCPPHHRNPRGWWVGIWKEINGEYHALTDVFVISFKVCRKGAK